MMRTATVLAGIAAVLLAFGPPPLGAQQAVTVEMRDYAFAPHEWTISVGTQVRWINFDETPHHVITEGSKILDSGDIAPGKDYTFAFTQAGRFTYRCAIHPTMLGVVTVQGQ